jgi:hypothetical protein
VGYDRKNCERITVTDCMLWTNFANIFRFGYDHAEGAIQDVTARNIEMIHFVGNRLIDEFRAKCVWYIQPSNKLSACRLRFEDIHINSAGVNNTLVKILPMRGVGWPMPLSENVVPKDLWPNTAWDYLEPGCYVKDCYFKNNHLAGKAGGRPGMIFAVGADAKHYVENLMFENVSRFGQPILADSPDVQIGPHAGNIKFLNAKKFSTFTHSAQPAFRDRGVVGRCGRVGRR